MKVAFLVVPSINDVLTMWRDSFNYLPLSDEEYKSIERDIVMGGCGLLRGRWETCGSSEIERKRESVGGWGGGGGVD
jgi:hypothetical protein